MLVSGRERKEGREEREEGELEVRGNSEGKCQMVGESASVWMRVRGAKGR